MEDDAFGLGGGAGGVLDEGRGVGFRWWAGDGWAGGELGDVEDVALVFPGAEDEFRAGVCEDGVEAEALAFSGGRVGWDGDGTGLPDGEEAGDEVGAGGAGEDDGLAGGAAVDEGCGDGAGFPGEGGEIEGALGAAVEVELAEEDGVWIC